MTAFLLAACKDTHLTWPEAAVILAALAVVGILVWGWVR